MVPRSALFAVLVLRRLLLVVLLLLQVVPGRRHPTPVPLLRAPLGTGLVVQRVCQRLTVGEFVDAEASYAVIPAATIQQ